GGLGGGSAVQDRAGLAADGAQPSGRARGGLAEELLTPDHWVRFFSSQSMIAVPSPPSLAGWVLGAGSRASADRRRTGGAAEDGAAPPGRAGAGGPPRPSAPAPRRRGAAPRGPAGS